MQSCNPGFKEYRYIYLNLLRFTGFPHGLFLAVFTVGKTERTWEKGGREMKVRTAGWVQQIRFVALASALVFLACMDAMATDVEQRIPVIRDNAGSGLTMEISREGTRQTATPHLTLNHPTVERIEGRIARQIDRLAAKETPSGTTFAGSFPRVGPNGAPREDSGRTETGLSSVPPVSGEITFRSVKNFLKGLRTPRKEKPAPAVVVAVPEQRLGMSHASPH